MCIVLLVEDSAIQQLLIRKKLPDAEITAVESLAEARQWLAEECCFDVVILDLGLPDANGVSTYTAVKDLCDGIPVIIYTADDDLEVALDCIRQGAETVIVKPDGNALERAVAYATEKHKRRQALESQVAAKVRAMTCDYAKNIATAKETLRETAKQLGKDEPWQGTETTATRSC